MALTGNEFQDEKGTQGGLIKYLWGKFFTFINTAITSAVAAVDLTGYYTKTETDEAIATSVGAEASARQTAIDALTASLANYDTKSEAAANIQAAINALIDNAPTALNTLKKLSDDLATLGADETGLAAQLAALLIGLEAKASQTALDATNVVVANKADQTALATTNANVAALTTTAAGKVDLTWLKAQMALMVSELEKTIEVTRFSHFDSRSVLRGTDTVNGLVYISPMVYYKLPPRIIGLFDTVLGIHYQSRKIINNTTTAPATWADIVDSVKDNFEFYVMRTQIDNKYTIYANPSVFATINWDNIEALVCSENVTSTSFTEFV